MSEDKNTDALLAVAAILRECQSSQKRAVLKRNVGETLETAKNVSWFYYLAYRHEKFSNSLLFLAATLIAQDKKTIEAFGKAEKVPGGPRNLGATLDLLERLDDSDAHKKRLMIKPDPARRESRYERRLRLLLDADLERDGSGELTFRLRQCVTIVLQKDGLINWPQLLADIDRWGLPSKSVQKEWAKAFYGSAPSDDTNTNHDAPDGEKE
ncbi:type I-E CRISPR-associated protein Cse2/CasB [Armatimonas sp.]|uniref:type I-E CRISPR-associated protein Cse2/CasB n=1 Tax=Armatimonas sp. TaxID=1872638 RepID=UPI003752E89C